MAAHRAGIRHVIMPKKNQKDLKEIPASVQVCQIYVYICTLNLRMYVYRLNLSSFLFQPLMTFYSMLLM